MKDYIIEKEFTQDELQCVVVFLSVGHRCGYVGVPYEHPLHGRECDEVSGMVSAHGGLNYSYEDTNENGDFPLPLGLWWFGFDCAHAGDGQDLALAKERFPNDPSIDFLIQMERQFPVRQYETVRSLEYVEEECRELARQLSTLPIEELQGGEDYVI